MEELNMTWFVSDIHEQIFTRLDVKDLVICKCVCKSWHSFISSPGFVKTQLKVSKAIGPHRRIYMMDDPTSPPARYLVGSCNGLVCISKISNEVLVANPSTREVRTLKSPELPWINNKSLKLCWGFGYDSSTDDYKVIVGHMESSSHAISFQMLSLKSNVWEDIGKVNVKSIICAFGVVCIGTLWAGKLHWCVRYQNDRRVILSFNLSTDKFKEIPFPDDIIRDFGAHRLGVIKGCLCIYRAKYNNGKWVVRVWVKNDDDVNQPWKVRVYDNGIENQVVHVVKPLVYLPNKTIFCTDPVFLCEKGYYISSPIYVPSLVSPHEKC